MHTGASIITVTFMSCLWQVSDLRISANVCFATLHRHALQRAKPAAFGSQKV